MGVFDYFSLITFSNSKYWNTVSKHVVHDQVVIIIDKFLRWFIYNSL